MERHPNSIPNSIVEFTFIIIIIEIKKEEEIPLFFFFLFKFLMAYSDIVLGEDGEGCQEVIIFSHNYRSWTCPMLLYKRNSVTIKLCI